MTVVGLLHPGAMGASIGAAALTNSEKVLWASENRGDATRLRADRARLTNVGSVKKLIDQSDIILSVCPPDSAMDLAEAVFSEGYQGLYVDCNAIAPGQAREMAVIAEAAGAVFVDGGIIGGPAWKAESGTRLWLSGDAVAQVIALFENSPLHASAINGKVGAASALKMTFAAYTKGSTALLTAILAVAEQEGVRDALAEQWGEAFTAQTHRQVVVNSAKAWRFSGEMKQIAETFDGAGLPGGFHSAAAEVFNRLASFKDWQTEPELEALLQALIEPPKREVRL